MRNVASFRAWRLLHPPACCRTLQTGATDPAQNKGPGRRPSSHEHAQKNAPARSSRGVWSRVAGGGRRSSKPQAARALSSLKLAIRRPVRTWLTSRWVWTVFSTASLASAMAASTATWASLA